MPAPGLTKKLPKREFCSLKLDLGQLLNQSSAAAGANTDALAFYGESLEVRLLTSDSLHVGVAHVIGTQSSFGTKGAGHAHIM